VSPSDVRSLRTRVEAGERLAGALVRMPCEEIVEMLGVAGLDFVLVDCEHGPADLLALRHHVALAEARGLPVLVRTPPDDPTLVLRALDHGACGVVAAHVDSAADAERLVRSVHYPPTGDRGFAVYSRAGRFGTVDAEAHRRAASETLVVAMIESPTGVRSVAEILATPGIDGYLVGTSDLAATSGPLDPTPAEQAALVHAAGREAGAARLQLAGDREAAAAAWADGAQLVVYNLTQLLMGVLVGLRPES
jgi:4-hydroxy-2-oxoheptanedioate aldolase